MTAHAYYGDVTARFDKPGKVWPRIVIDENGKRLSRLPGHPRESTDSRERALTEAGTQWLKAMRFADYVGADSADVALCCELATQAIAEDLAAVPAEYGLHEVYGGRGPALRPLDGEANLDSADGQYGPALIAELRDSADAIIAGAHVFTHHERPESAEQRDVALEVAGRLAS